jgi:ArsR family transcriptional regulator, arsenate/arsenite/antimonite-responsive transcriptional repressor
MMARSRALHASDAVRRLVALGHDTRLALFRRLVQIGPNGLSAGALAAALDIPPSSLTFHLQQLLHARLISQRRVGRQLFYAIEVAAMNGLLAYLTENCCGRDVGACAPLCNPAQQAAPELKRRRPS